jgi:hypothetical protein
MALTAWVKEYVWGEEGIWAFLVNPCLKNGQRSMGNVTVNDLFALDGRGRISSDILRCEKCRKKVRCLMV